MNERAISVARKNEKKHSKGGTYEPLFMISSAASTRCNVFSSIFFQ